MKFVRELQNWCKDNGGPENTKTDPNSIVSRLSLLFSIFSDIRQRCYHDMRECDDGIGRNIDSLLQLVFGDLHYAQYRCVVDFSDMFSLTQDAPVQNW